MSVYDILGVSITDSDEDIRKAYLKLCRENHPDKGGSSERMAEITKAYAQIDTPEKRKEYNTRNAWVYEFNLFSSVLGRPTVAQNFGKKPIERKAVNGTDIELHVKIPFSVFLGGYPGMMVEYDRDKVCLECDGTGAKQAARCSHCGGSGRVRNEHTRRLNKCSVCDGTGIKISEKCPMCDGGKVRKHVKTMIDYRPGMLEAELVGKGNSGMHGGQNGKLFVRFQVDFPEWFRDEGGKYVIDGPEIWPEDLVLGKWVEVGPPETPIRVRIPPNSARCETETILQGGITATVRFTMRGQSTPFEDKMYKSLREFHANLETEA